MAGNEDVFKGKRVLIVGGGVSGLSAAHELVERGFKVTVYEQRPDPSCGHAEHERADAFGGKARSYRVAMLQGGPATTAPRYTRVKHPSQRGNAADADRPGEHGFRFFPAFYRHLPDTMARIPAVGGGFVADKLITPGRDQFASYRVGHRIPFPQEFPSGKDVGDFRKLLDGAVDLGLEPDDIFTYFKVLWQVLTSCKDRRLKEYENISWYDFVGANTRSAAFHDYFGVGSTRNLVASRSESANARIIAEVSIQTWMPILFPRPWNFADLGDRVLSGPTQDVWIRPWVDYLKSKGVDFQTDLKLVKIGFADGEVDSLTFVRGALGNDEINESSLEPNLEALRPLKNKGISIVETRTRAEFDYFVLALPVERIALLMHHAIGDLDPDLKKLRSLAKDVHWMSGIQFYLEELPDGYESLTGHVNFVDSPWALTAILQSLSWERQFRLPLRNEGVRAILSVCVSDWKKKGFNGKTAEECLPDEIATEVWNQIVRGLPALQNVVGKVRAPVGANIAKPGGKKIGKHLAASPAYALDDDLQETKDRNRSLKNLGIRSRVTGGEIRLLQNAEPLLVNTKGSWAKRPRAGTRIRNLVLAGDYIRTNTGLACMESANESAREAVNEILRRSNSDAKPCEIWELAEPAFFKAAQMRDRARFERGEPWRDLPGSPMSLFVEGGGHVAKFFQLLNNRRSKAPPNQADGLP